MTLLVPFGCIGRKRNDKHLTENCGILKNLLSGDTILVDRGFDIEHGVSLFLYSTDKFLV